MPQSVSKSTDGFKNAPPPQRMPLGQWRDAAIRSFLTLGRENFTLIGAGCAFYALLALAPTLGALAAFYGLFADPAAIARHLDVLRDIAPPAAYEIVQNQAQALSAAEQSTLGWSSLGAVLFAIWSARSGVRALMIGVGLAYREHDKRGVVMALVATYALTFVLILLAALTLALLVVLPAILAIFPFGDVLGTLANVARWPLGLAAVMFGLGLLYRYAPNRRVARPSWVTPGALVAVFLWLVGSLAFTAYLSRFGNYNETYGALGAVAALLMWFWVSALAALLGAIFNAELELQTDDDTTAGAARPMGQRGAFVADNVIGD